MKLLKRNLSIHSNLAIRGFEKTNKFSKVEYQYSLKTYTLIFYPSNLIKFVKIQPGVIEN